jgi:hypothetical protein
MNGVVPSDFASLVAFGNDFLATLVGDTFMWIGALIFALAGFVFANGIPHFVKGGMGLKHQTPFGKPSSAVLNVIWGAINLLGGFWLGIWGSTHEVPVNLAGTAVVVGMTLMAVINAAIWKDDPVGRGE